MQNNKLMGKLTDLLIFLPIFWTFTGLFHFHNGDKILVVLTLISALISAIKYNKTIITYNLKSRYIWMMYGLLLISIIADAFGTYNPINVRAIAIVCVLLTFFPYKLITRNTLIITTLLGSINSLLFVYKFTEITPIDRQYWPINAIPFATYICFIATISFILLLTSNTIKDKITLILIFVISIISLALTETRGALVALLPTLLATYFYFSYKRKLLKRNILISVFIIGFSSIALYPIIKERIIQTHQEITQIDDGNTDTSIGLRLNFWRAGFQLIEKSPFIGYGNNYFSQLNLLAKRKSYYPSCSKI
ncbi:O-antigen ligase family protein [Photobacterium leiognathi]|uniref:O-antigen ligase family protein n=1 Tax=Photobacterium leiognathi TaxID=553611 RepID=UPI002739AD2F|nr:O-antigen ligase family protein [Photobacterium leiognathi]